MVIRLYHKFTHTLSCNSHGNLLTTNLGCVNNLAITRLLALLVDAADKAGGIYFDMVQTPCICILNILNVQIHNFPFPERFSLAFPSVYWLIKCLVSRVVVYLTEIDR